MEENMRPQQAFHGDKKLPMNSLLGSLERKLIQATVQKIPRWIEGYHLTLMTVVWSVGLILFGYLAQWSRHWLWLSSLMVFLQWFTDSYDGALGRLRDTGIPKWGYYMDHFLDYVFLCSVFIGYSFILGKENTIIVYALLLIFTGFMMNSYLSFAATNEFKITFLGCGPTEIRIVFIVMNIGIIFWGVAWLAHALPYLIPIALLGLIVVVSRTQRYIWGVDMRDKQSRGRQ